MAKSKTPAKRIRQAEKSKLRNMARRSAMKSAIKKFEAAVAGKNVDLARESLVMATSIIDRNAARGIIHRNTAARKKSRLTRKLNNIA
ncbi:MAG: 30S ribosomal protein S20 [Methylocystaceae bacterium]